MTLISYAKNMEDVMLWRTLKHVGNGTYIDFRAQDPVIDSVSLAFYEHGWRGMHVTNSEHVEKLKAARSDEAVIAVSDSATLAAAFDKVGNGEIHWVRIAKSMLESWGNDPVRPWIVLVENPDEADEILLSDKGYDFVYFDGLDRFYLSRQHSELASAFSSPPNLLDDFTLSGKAGNPFCNLLNSRIVELESEVQALQASNAKYAALAGKLAQRLLERNKKWAARLMERLPRTIAIFPESAHLPPRAQRIYAKLVQAMEGKT